MFSIQQERPGNSLDGFEKQRIRSSLPIDEQMEAGPSSIIQNPQKWIFKVEGMCCATEVEHLKGVLNPLLNAAKINLSFDLINAKPVVLQLLVEFRKQYWVI